MLSSLGAGREPRAADSLLLSVRGVARASRSSGGWVCVKESNPPRRLERPVLTQSDATCVCSASLGACNAPSFLSFAGSLSAFRVTGETRTHTSRDHNPVLCPIELRPQRGRLELNQCERALQTRASPLGHVLGVGQLSVVSGPLSVVGDTSCRNRTCPFSICNRAFRHWNRRRSNAFPQLTTDQYNA